MKGLRGMKWGGGVKGLSGEVGRQRQKNRSIFFLCLAC